MQDNAPLGRNKLNRSNHRRNLIMSTNLEEKRSAAPSKAGAEKKFNTVPLNWREVYYTNCPLVSASNVDQ